MWIFARLPACPSFNSLRDRYHRCYLSSPQMRQSFDESRAFELSFRGLPSCQGETGEGGRARIDAWNRRGGGGGRRGGWRVEWKQTELLSTPKRVALSACFDPSGEKRWTVLNPVRRIEMHSTGVNCGSELTKPISYIYFKREKDIRGMRN